MSRDQQATYQHSLAIGAHPTNLCVTDPEMVVIRLAKIDEIPWSCLRSS